MVSQAILDQYELVIGLEIHAQLMTQSKIFASDATTFGQAPNTNISLITLAHPGTLPKLNEKVAALAIRMGLAMGSEISRYNIFDRKNYFYPDSPKGYQITQEKTPICIGGSLKVTTDKGEVNIRLNRIHLEEDAGKSIHPEGARFSQVDLNRAGVPLIEIVTEPDLRSPEEAMAYITEMRRLVRYLEVCDGNMEEGSLRCDANVSVRKKGATEYGQKVEVKNLNSIRNVGRAIIYEKERQIKAIEKGAAIRSETRLFNAQNGSTSAMRTKETLTDYRYFPDPDLPPFIIKEEMLAEIKNAMPALPWQVTQKLQEKYGLPAYDARVLSDEKSTANYFEAVAEHTKAYKAISNWLMGPVKAWTNEQKKSIEDFPLNSQKLAILIEVVESGKVSFAAASQKLFLALLENPAAKPEELAAKLGLIQQGDDDFLIPIIQEIIETNPDKVKAYKNGKKGLVGFFMGELMKKSNGKADPKKSNNVVREMLEKA